MVTDKMTIEDLFFNIQNEWYVHRVSTLVRGFVRGNFLSREYCNGSLDGLSSLSLPSLSPYLPLLKDAAVLQCDRGRGGESQECLQDLSLHALGRSVQHIS